MCRLLLPLLAALPVASAAFEPTAELPDLLTALDGSAVATPSQWEARRAELKTLVQEHILGVGPPYLLIDGRVRRPRGAARS